jgi:Holliday junction resolvase
MVEIKNKYKYGVDYERKLVKKAKERGLIAFRSAGSHSPIDVVIIDQANMKVWLLQCKYGRSYTEADKKKELDKLLYLNGFYKVETKVMGWEERNDEL